MVSLTFLSIFLLMLITLKSGTGEPVTDNVTISLTTMKKPMWCSGQGCTCLDGELADCGERGRVRAVGAGGAGVWCAGDAPDPPVSPPAVSSLADFSQCRPSAEGYQPALRKLNVPNVTTLRLVHGLGPPEQKTLPGSTLHLDSLIKLELWNNDLTKVDKNAFEGLTNLNELDLTDNDLMSLPAGVFTPCPKLKLVRLNGNNLTARLNRDWWGEEPPLKTYIISWQRGWGTPISLWASNMLQLTEIFAEGAGFYTLPEDSFIGSTEITDLHLASNFLVTLPSKLFSDQQKLQSLDLSYNFLEKFPIDVFRPLSNLSHLNMNFNKLKLLPEGLFNESASIKFLTLRGNQIEDFSPKALEGLSSLTTLDLSQNLIYFHSPDYPPVSPLGILKAVKVVNLTENKLTTLYYDWQHMGSLETIDLTWNKIHLLYAKDLNFTDTSVVVDLRYNGLTSIFIKELEINTLSRSLMIPRLDKNPLVCDCRMKGLQNTHVSTADGWSVICELPAELHHKNISNTSLPDAPCDAPECVEGCDCLMAPEIGSLAIFCKNVTETEELKTLPEHTSLGLNWTEMTFQTTPSDSAFLYVPDHIRNLTVSGVELKKISEDWKPSPNLKTLNIANNNLTTLPKSLLELNDTDLRVQFANNTLNCECDNQDRLKLMIKAKGMFDDWESIECYNGQNLTEASMQYCGVSPLTISGAIVAAAVAILGLTYLFVWRARRRRRQRLEEDSDDEADYEYDIFVSFCHADTEFVQQEIVERLEPEWHLCVHYRDWIIGEFIPTQILSSVKRSRRVLIVVSPEWQTSQWSQEEVRVAVAFRPRAVLVLVRGGVEDLLTLAPALEEYYRTRTVLSELDVDVWTRLRSALPKPISQSRVTTDDSAKSLLSKKQWNEKNDLISEVDAEYLQLNSILGRYGVSLSEPNDDTSLISNSNHPDASSESYSNNEDLFLSLLFASSSDRSVDKCDKRSGVDVDHLSGTSCDDCQNDIPHGVQDIITRDEFEGETPNDSNDILPNIWNDISPDNWNDILPDNCNDISPDNCNDISPDNCNGISQYNCNDISPDNCNGISQDNCNDISPDNCNNISPDNYNDYLSN